VRRRLDQELVRRGLTTSRTEARDAIMAGRVTVAGRPAMKPGGLIAAGEPVSVEGEREAFASRGGRKLRAALDRFAVVIEGRRCLDAGASTGGFTDVLLRAGASHVTAVDVGYGQLAWKLRTDARVTVLERTNVRDLTPEDLAGPAEVIVADLSFISLRTVLPALLSVAAADADLILLVKPQFEVGRGRVGRGGVVSDPGHWVAAIEGVAEACSALGAGPQDVVASPIRGPAGNVEFLLHARRGAEARVPDVSGAIRGAPER